MARSNAQQMRSICRLCSTVPSRPTAASLYRPALNSSAILQRAPAKARLSQLRWYAAAANAAKTPIPDAGQAGAGSGTPATRDITDPKVLGNMAEDSCKKFLSVDGIPARQLTAAALQSCLHAAATLHPQLSRAHAKAAKASSRLVALGQERGSYTNIDRQLADAVNKISYSAYTIISHPNVEMTPEFLETYVHIQAQLGRPESLPKVFALYASKRKPVVKDGEIVYVAQNPRSAARAIEVPVASMAVQTAIDARNLDAALGIIESAYCVPAFKRQKLLRHASAPAIALGSLPFGIFGMATAYASYWQNTMDLTTATSIGVVCISGYFFVVGSLGLIAKLSFKDQMKRVTWTPGTPLRQRWLREEERAALDKVACAWGFKEPWRHGEETGPEWEGLKEYMGYRQMLLDRVEFMDGMS
ncbi:hypothetical protein NLU13_2082 [Sarocladium strictum]|uniref:Uncharacterized protein n=1 Tax=Sarocladium strictum TaxID=5046 RepID=A0AA39GS71_SARSR|nr:hypothetical protein NLU13_2082 [Sarocladium strictum]